MTPPFTVLHVCMGNICRSPMSERLAALRVRELAGDRAEDLVLNHSCGLGGWHAGEGMNPPAAAELRRRGGADAGFTSRRIRRDHVEISDLVLTATAEQVEYIAGEWPGAEARTFAVRSFGAAIERIDAGALPSLSAEPSPEEVQERGRGLVAAADALRGGLPVLDLDDPWGLDSRTFTRIADELDAVLTPMTRTLLDR